MGLISTALILIAVVVRADPTGLKAIADAVNAIGASFTFLGVLYAVARANDSLRKWRKDVLRRLRGLGIPATVYASRAEAQAQAFNMSIIIDQDFTAADELADPVERLHARTDILLMVARNLQAMVTSAETEVRDVRRELVHRDATTRKELREGDDRARTEGAAALQLFADTAKQNEAIDLRLAIVGTFFQAFGAVLSFYT